MTAASLRPPSAKVALQRLFRVPSVSTLTRGWYPLGRNGHRHRGNAAWYGSRLLRRDCRDNVGKGLRPAGANSNLHRPWGIGTRSPTEAAGSAHEFVGA